MANSNTPYLVSHLPLIEGQTKLIESDLLGLLTIGNLDPPSALIAQSAYLRLLTTFLNQARAEAAIEFDADPQANDPYLDRFRSRMKGEGEGPPWAPLIAFSRKPASAARLRRVVLGSVLSALRGPGTRVSLLSRYVLFALGRGRLDFGEGIGSVSFRRMNAVRLEDGVPDLQKRLRDSLVEMIGSGSLFTYDDLRFSHHMMLIGFGLAHWAAAALAVNHSRLSPTDDDWNAALRFIDKALGPHSDFPARLDHDASLKTLLDALTSRPLFPYAMTRTE